jgi:DNA-binding transcriptional regulator YiaG
VTKGGKYMKKTKFNRDFFRKDLEKKLKNPEFRGAYEGEGLRLDIAMQIHKIRESENLTQKQFAKRIHLPQQKVSLMEQGSQNMTVDTLYKVAKGLGKQAVVKFV